MTVCCSDFDELTQPNAEDGHPALDAIVWTAVARLILNPGLVRDHHQTTRSEQDAQHARLRVVIDRNLERTLASA
jgi:hypothetical protein